VAVRAPQQAPTATVRAEAKWVRCSARKARLVLDLVRGQSVTQASTTLAFTPRAAARDVEKVLRSAVANAEANHGLHGEDLVVYAAYADEGPTLKRWRARARGRVNRIRKRTCHITVVLAPDPKAPVRTAEETRRRGVRRQRGAEAPAAVEETTAVEAAAETVEPEAQAAAGEAPVTEAVVPPEAEPEATVEEPAAEETEPEAAAPTAGAAEEAPSAEAAAPPETQDKPKRTSEEGT
jgi:large subunit ribosomal protein L22